MDPHPSFSRKISSMLFLKTFPILQPFLLLSLSLSLFLSLYVSLCLHFSNPPNSTRFFAFTFSMIWFFYLQTKTTHCDLHNPDANFPFFPQFPPNFPPDWVLIDYSISEEFYLLKNHSKQLFAPLEFWIRSGRLFSEI